MNIGNVKLDNPYILAPMAGVTDLRSGSCVRSRERVFYVWR